MAESIDISELFERLNSLSVDDISKIGTAPQIVKIFILIVVFILIIAVGSWFIIKPIFDNIKKSQIEETTLKDKYVVYQSKAANLTAFQQQLNELEKSFKVVLRQLPNSVNIEDLLIDLTQTSVASGILIDKFQPQNEDIQEFYANTPIDLIVKGSYHQFGHFVSGLASLARIVTLDEIKIKKADGDDPSKLIMQLQANTYRYLNKSELENKK